MGPGLVRECVVDTLAFGVPAYNSGDREGCAKFYVRSAESLCAAFSNGEQTTSLGGRAIADLKAALARAATHEDGDSKAWAIRYAFDKNMISWEAAVTQEKALLALGNQNFAGARYAEAADAFHDAAEVSRDVLGQELAQVDLGLRGAFLMSGHAFLAEVRFRDSAKAIMAGLAFVPEFPKNAFDLRSLFRADRYEGVVDRLRAAVEADPRDGDLIFLLGYVYYHTGKKGEARKEFDRVLQVAPGHAAAKLYGGEAPEPKKAKDF